MSFPVFDILSRRAELGPDRIAMEDIAHGKQVSYLEMNLRTGRTAALLAELGVAQGGRVAVLCRNRIEFFELLFACAKLGAILVPLNWRMPHTELEAPGSASAAALTTVPLPGATEAGLSDTAMAPDS